MIDRVIDVHIGKLRQKIEKDPSNPTYISTVRGVGYQFAETRRAMKIWSNMQKGLLWKLLGINILIIGFVIIIVWLAIDYLAADYL